jgi:Ca2+-transporting ATPase
MLIIAIALLLGYESPLTASQLIWLNLVTDTFLVVALAVEPKEDNLLSAGWKRGKEKLITLVMVERMLLMASVMTLGTIIFYDQYLTIAPERASTIALTMLVVFQWFNILNCRSEQESVVSPRLKRNRALMFSFFGAVILQIVAMNVTFFQNILEIGPLPLYDWSAIIAAGLLIIVMDELRKVVYRARVRKEF